MEGSEGESSKDDSLADFKSPRLEPVPRAHKLKISNEKRAKKINRTKRKQPEASRRNLNEDSVQPSIESSFFKAAAVSNRDKGHTCPLCMKYFADASLGTAHSKSCAAKNNVSTKKLLTAVALQKRQADERLAIGLPAGPFLQPKNKTPRRPREPVSSVDPELQLALALSKSLQETELEQEFEEALMLAAEHRGDEPAIPMTSFQLKRTLKNFGFSTDKASAPVIPAGPLKSRRRKHLGPTVLQTRSQESRDRLLTDRIAEVLMGNEAITQLSQCPNTERVERPAPVLRSRLLNEIHRITERLWDSARLSPEVTNFYVDNLSPVVAPVADRQPEVSASEDASASKPEENQPSTGNPSEMDDKMAAATEMAIISTLETRSVHVTDREYRNTLPTDWSSILNVSSMSDLVIIVKSNHIWAHKLVLHVRCCDILLDIEPNDDAKYAHVKERVCWPDVDFFVATAFLEFVYGGIIDKNEHIFDDNRALAGVRRLARKYRLKDLFDYLRKRKAEIGIRRDVESRRDGLSEPIVVDVSEIGSEIADSREDRPKRTRSYENRENRDERDENEEIHRRHSAIRENRLKVGTIEEMDVAEDAIRRNAFKTGENEENRLPNEASRENRFITDKIEETRPNDSIKEKRSKATKTEETTIRENHRRSKPEVSQRTKITIVRSPIPVTSSPRVEDEAARDVVTVSSSDRSSTTSPDLFDETLQQSLGMDAESTDSPAASEQSTAENSNLKLLAQLIEDDVSSERSSQESSLRGETKENPTISSDPEDSRSPESKPEVSTPAKGVVDSMETSRHAETPRSRGAEDARLGCSSQPKAKSNLSLFIDKIRVINGKPASDSCTDEESLAGVLDRRRFRNPFNLDNASNPSTPSAGNDEANAREDDSRRENSPESVAPVNDTFCTDDADVSAYSKYRRANKRNNSIAKYREMLKTMHSNVGEGENEKSDVETSGDDVDIDLTQESDEEPPASCSSVHPPNRILDTDCNDSTPSDRRPRSDSREEAKVVEDRGKSPMTRVLEDDAEKRTASDGSDEATDTVAEATDGPRDSLALSDLDVFEIDEEILLPSPLESWQKASSSLRFSSAMTTEKSRRGEYADGADDDRSRRSGNVETCVIVGSSGETNTRHSSDYPDSDVVEINDQALTQGGTNTPPRRSPGRSGTSGDASKSGETEAKSAEVSSDEDATPRNDSARRKSPGSSPEYPYANSSRTNEIFTQSSENLDNRTESRRARLSSDSQGGIDFENAKDHRDVQPFRLTNSSPRDPSNCSFSYDFPEVDFFENEIFTQSFKNTDEPYGATSPLIPETPAPCSSILVSSSPELDGNLGELLTGEADKENSVERSASLVEPRRDHFTERFSPLCREEPWSPRAAVTSARERDSSHSVKKLMARSISMPESTLTRSNSRKRTRTPRKSAREAMSRELTPPRNYDAMDTPELKRELAKYGIKPQKRKRARQLLNHIYNELHQDVAMPSSRESLTNEPVGTDDHEGPPSKKIGKIDDRNSNDSESDRDLALSQERYNRRP